MVFSGSERMTIGRAEDNNVIVEDAEMSRHHAEIILHPDGTAEIKDRGSRSGTFVNDQRVESQLLRDGDHLSIGPLHAVFRFKRSAPSTATTRIPLRGDNNAQKELQTAFEALKSKHSEKTGELAKLDALIDDFLHLAAQCARAERHLASFDLRSMEASWNVYRGQVQQMPAGDKRRAVAKTITLLESTRPDHRARADDLLNALLPHSGRSFRLGISGVPGVGKSTFIEALGLMLIGRGHRVAVLAVDPSSSVSGGSILGDKTRMEQLSMDERAYIRPSPSSGTLGGVAEKTREAMLVCEAAGHDVVIVETVGVGQSETAVASMTDLFVLLQLPNAGDDLQALKKGVMELADLIVVNKADLDPAAATRARAQIASSLRLFAGHDDAPRVLLMSALKGEGIDAFRSAVDEIAAARRASGRFERRRQEQAQAWMWDIVAAGLRADFRAHPAVRAQLPSTLQDVIDARTAPSAAARRLLSLFENT